MANVHRGEVAFEAGGKSYTLRLANNAVCELEGLLNRGFMDIDEELRSWAPPLDETGVAIPETKEQQRVRVGRIRMTMVRAVMWAALRERHRDITLFEAGEVIDDLGGLIPAWNLITSTMFANLPKADPPKPGQNDPQAQAAPGTGPA